MTHQTAIRTATGKVNAAKANAAKANASWAQSTNDPAVIASAQRKLAAADQNLVQAIDQALSATQ